MGNKAQRIVRTVGPWPDGLITRHEGSYDVAETFLHDVINLDISDYGVLIPRPGFVRFHPAWGDGWPGSFVNYGPLRLLGSHPTTLGGTKQRLYISQLELRAGNWQEDVFYTDDPTSGSPGLLFSNNHGASEPNQDDLFSQVLLYNGKLYFIRRSQAPAGSFINNVIMDNGDTTGATAVGSGANTKFGYYAFIMQDRAFVVDMNGSRVNYSKATDPTEWNAPDGGFFDVNPNDAQRVNAVIALENVVYIFKEESTYAFTFNTDPTVDGVVRTVSRSYGALDAVNRGSEIYVANRYGIFTFVDGNFIDIAENISNIIDAPAYPGKDVSLTVVEDRLIVGYYYDSGSFTCLCMNLKTNAWTKYEPSDTAIGPTSKRSYPVTTSSGKSWMVWGDYASSVEAANIATGTGYLSMMRIGTDLATPDDRCRDEDKTGNIFVPHYLAVTVPMALDDPTRWKKLYRARYDIQHADNDNADAFAKFEIREGSPDVVDDSETFSTYKDYYTNFFDSTTNEPRRFKVIQFGIEKPEDQTGAGIDEPSQLRIRGLSMDYAVKGPFRN